MLFETNFTEQHSISAGLSLNHDYYKQHYRLTHDVNAPLQQWNEKETTPGAYVQYTFNWHDQWVIMAGLRADHSSQYGTFVTPRFHLKYAPNHVFNLRLSAGKGYRTVHALGEYNYLMAKEPHVND